MKDVQDYDFLRSNSEMGGLFRSYDWSHSPLGCPGSWSAKLQNTVSLMLHSAFPMFVAWGKGELVLLYNDAYIPMLGKKHPEAFGCSFREVWSEIWPTLRLLLDRVFAGEALYFDDLELTLLRKGYPEQARFTFSYSPIFHDGDKVCGMFCAVTETTSRFNTEKQQSMLLDLGDTLRELHEDPDAMMRAATKAVATFMNVPRVGFTDVDETGEYGILGQTYTDTRYVPDNLPTKFRLDDYGPEIIANLRTGQLLKIDDMANDPCAASPGMLAHEAEGARASLAVPIRHHGQTVAFMFAHHHTSRRWTDKEANLLQEAANRTWDAVQRARAELALKQAAQRKDEFLAMLSHELRNPLAPIISAAELLKLAQLDPERLKTTSDIIIRQVDHMTGLIDDLLDVSRVTRGLITLEKEDVDIKQVVTDAIEQTRRLIESRHHYLTVETSPDAAYVLGDKKRLVQIVANLLTNAAKYTPDGGKITVHMEVHHDEVVLCVIDNGIGMAAEFIPVVFNLFSQATRTSDRAQGGLGLGLALVKSLVELHGGSVTARSEGIGKGSRVIVRLPLLLTISDSNAISPSQERHIAVLAKPLQLLIVDDNVDAAKMLSIFLETIGYQVIIEHAPHGAIAQAQHRDFDACFLDIGLPDMSGNELARRLRSQPGTSNSMLIAVTGYGQQYDRETSMAAGFDHYFVKPASPLKLANLLKELN